MVERGAMIKTGIGIVVGVVGLLGLDVLFAKYEEKKRRKAIRNSLENGSYPLVNKEAMGDLLLRGAVQKTSRNNSQTFSASGQ